MEYTHSQLITKLTTYNGNSAFIKSVQKFYVKNNFITGPQKAALTRNFFSEKYGTNKEYTVKPEEKITIRKWLARSLAGKHKMPFFFRNLIIEEVIAETNKAIQVKVRFNSEIAACCHCCGRGLDNDVSKATGIGPVCATKYFKVKRPTIENAREIIEKIEQEAKNAGVIGPIWIPKSQIISDAQKVLFGAE